MKDFQMLLKFMGRLRDPEQGTSWDQRQDFSTIAPYTIEEAYEVADAIERDDMDELCSELGDLLFQVVYHAQIASEKNLFDFNHIVQRINDKLVTRHPHLMSQKQGQGVRQSPIWEDIKENERKEKAQSRGMDHSILDGIGQSIPSLSRAQKLQMRAAQVGFDWRDIDPVFEKIDEEIKEINYAVRNNESDERLHEELGDLLFACVNLARHLKVDAETALRRANNKFITRFKYIETSLNKENKVISEASLKEMDNLWEKAKQL